MNDGVVRDGKVAGSKPPPRQENADRRKPHNSLLHRHGFLNNSLRSPYLAPKKIMKRDRRIPILDPVIPSNASYPLSCQSPSQLLLYHLANCIAISGVRILLLLSSRTRCDCSHRNTSVNMFQYDVGRMCRRVAVSMFPRPIRHPRSEVLCNHRHIDEEI